MRMFSLATLLCFVLALSVSACTNPEPPATTPASTQVTIPARSGIWIDVRTPEEFDKGHLKDAINITPETLAEKISSVAPDKNSEIHLYCRSGRRAENARKILVDLGYTNVSNQGGYEDLLKKGHQ